MCWGNCAKWETKLCTVCINNTVCGWKNSWRFLSLLIILRNLYRFSSNFKLADSWSLRVLLVLAKFRWKRPFQSTKICDLSQNKGWTFWPYFTVVYKMRWKYHVQKFSCPYCSLRGLKSIHEQLVLVNGENAMGIIQWRLNFFPLIIICHEIRNLTLRDGLQCDLYILCMSYLCFF